MKNIFYLDFKKALREDYLVKRDEIFAKYADEKKKGYTMLKGTPLFRNIEGHIVLEQDIPELLSGNQKQLHQKMVEKGTTIMYRWKM